MALNTKCYIHGNAHPDFLCPLRKNPKWLYALQLATAPTTRHIGNSFVRACAIAHMAEMPVWEHKEYPGNYVVDVGPLLQFDANVENWRQCQPITAISLGALNQRATLAYDKKFDRDEYTRRSEKLKQKIACRIGAEPSWQNEQFYNTVLTNEEIHDLLELEEFLNKELGQ